MNRKEISPEDRELLESYENDEWQTVDDFVKDAMRFKEYAKATTRKNSRINIRISSKDLEAIQKKALEEGIPYQTLIASVLHKYVSGRLAERSE